MPPGPSTGNRAEELAWECISTVALWIQKDGSQLRQDVDRYYDRLPGVSMDQILQYGHARSWIVDRGDRVGRGEVEPSLQDLGRGWLYGSPVLETVPVTGV